MPARRTLVYIFALKYFYFSQTPIFTLVNKVKVANVAVQNDAISTAVVPKHIMHRIPLHHTSSIVGQNSDAPQEDLYVMMDKWR